jgi:collagen type VII alpha
MSEHSRRATGATGAAIATGTTGTTLTAHTTRTALTTGRHRISHQAISTGAAQPAGRTQAPSTTDAAGTPGPAIAHQQPAAAALTAHTGDPTSTGRAGIHARTPGLPGARSIGTRRSRGPRRTRHPRATHTTGTTITDQRRTTAHPTGAPTHASSSPSAASSVQPPTATAGTTTRPGAANTSHAPITDQPRSPTRAARLARRTRRPRPAIAEQQPTNPTVAPRRGRVGAIADQRSLQ